MKKIVFVVLALIVVVGMVQASDMRFGAKVKSKKVCKFLCHG